MGIEYISDATLISRNQRVTNGRKRCVRFLCGKRRHPGQLQRTAANVTFGAAGVEEGSVDGGTRSAAAVLPRTGRRPPAPNLAGPGRRDFAVKDSYAFQRNAQVPFVSTYETGLGFRDQ
jgi:hypothetical protein